MIIITILAFAVALYYGICSVALAYVCFTINSTPRNAQHAALQAAARAGLYFPSAELTKKLIIFLAALAIAIATLYM